VAEVDLAVARENVRSAEFGVKSAEASLAEAIENLRKTSVYAPIEGIVTRLNVRRGERVVGTEMMAGTELMHIADLSKMQVVVTVNENDIIRVKKGDTATVEIDAYYGNILKGVVTEIAHSATTTGQLTDQVTTFEVKIELLPSSYSHLVSNVNPYPLRPGMTANVDIHTQVKFNVVSVPLSALTARVLKNDTTIRSSTGSTNVVFVVKNNRAWMRRVITGIQDENYIEIVSGVSPGESVVVGPFIAVSKLLSDSSRVVIENKVKNLNE